MIDARLCYRDFPAAAACGCCCPQQLEWPSWATWSSTGSSRVDLQALRTCKPQEKIAAPGGRGLGIEPSVRGGV